MQPEIFRSFLQRCVENQTRVSVVTSISGNSENGYYEGIITEFDEEVISLLIREEKTTIISRKYIVSCSEGEEKDQPELKEVIVAKQHSPKELEEMKRAWKKISENSKYLTRTQEPSFEY